MEVLRLLESPTSLYEFTQLLWPVVEPANPFVPNWHIEAIAEHLEACTFGEIRNLIINIPPGMMKSLLVCVFWPCWVWTFNPAFQWIFGSHAEGLALRDSKKCRRLLASPEYKALFAPQWQIISGDDNASKFVTSQSGHRIATGVGGQGTGERADGIVADDPIKTGDSDSPQVLKTAELWWFETLGSRDRDLSTCARVIVMQRLAEADLTGVCLERGNYEILRLRMEYSRHATLGPTKLGFVDPRTEEGELLFPARAPREAVEALKARLGSYGTASQLDQEPKARGGNFIKRGWFEPFNPYFTSEPRDFRCLWWDLGASDSPTADKTVGTVTAKYVREDDKNPRFIHLWQHAGQWNPMQRQIEVLKVCKLWDNLFPGISVYLEAGIGEGVNSIQELRNALISDGINAIIKGTGGQSKLQRAAKPTGETGSWLAAAEAHRIELYSGNAFEEFGLANPIHAWINPFLEEVTSLSEDNGQLKGPHDDRFDSSVAAVGMLSKMRIVEVNFL